MEGINEVLVWGEEMELDQELNGICHSAPESKDMELDQELDGICHSAPESKEMELDQELEGVFHPTSEAKDGELKQELEGNYHSTSGPKDEKLDTELEGNFHSAPASNNLEFDVGLVESLDRELEKMAAADTKQETLPPISGEVEDERKSNSLPGVINNTVQGGKGGDREGIHHPDFLPKGLDPKCSEVERKLKEDLKDWLESGPLEGSIKTGRFLVNQLKGYLMMPGTTAKLAKLGVWGNWLRVIEVLDEVLGVKEKGEWYVAVAFESKWRLEENKDAIFEMFNPGCSREAAKNEDIRYSKKVRVSTKKFNIPFQFIQNWRECTRVVGTKLHGRPNNAEDILYGKRASVEYKRGTGFKDQRGHGDHKRAESKIKVTLANERVTNPQHSRGNRDSVPQSAADKVRVTLGKERVLNPQLSRGNKSMLPKGTGQDKTLVTKGVQVTVGAERNGGEGREVKLVKEGIPITSGGKSEGIPTLPPIKNCDRKEKMEREYRERLRRNALKELDDQIRQLGKLEPASAGAGALGLCGWGRICKEEFCPELLPKSPMYMGDEEKGKWGEEYQDFRVETFPRNLVEEVRDSIIEIVEEEMNVGVESADEYCTMVKRLGLRIERLGKTIAFKAVDIKVGGVMEWKAGYEEKDKGRRLRFYIKARAGEFARAAAHHVVLVEDFMVGEEDTPNYMIAEELPVLLGRLWYFYNLNVGVKGKELRG